MPYKLIYDIVCAVRHDSKIKMVFGHLAIEVIEITVVCTIFFNYLYFLFYVNLVVNMVESNDIQVINLPD